MEDIDSEMDDAPLLTTDGAGRSTPNTNTDEVGPKLQVSDGTGIEQFELAPGDAPGAAGLGEATITSSIINLLNTIVGAGMLGLPHAFSESGTLTGTVLLLLAGMGSTLSLHLLTVSQETVGIKPSSFYTVAQASVPSFTKLIDAAVVIKCFGVGTSYLIAIGDLVPDIMEDIGGPQNRELWISLAFLVVAPLSFFKTLDALKATSTISLVCVAMIAIFIVGFAFDLDPHDPSNIPTAACDNATDAGDEAKDDTGCQPNGSAGMYATTDGFRTARVFTIYVFSFTCQQNIFAVWSELKDGSVERVDKVITRSMGTAAALYLVVAWAGFYTYGVGVESDVLNNYPRTTVVSFVRFFIVLLVAFSYPLQAHPARKCALSLYAAVALRKDPDGAPDVPGIVPFYLITAAFVLGSYGVAMSVHDLGIVLALVGATGSTMVSYILPGAIFYKLHPNGGLLQRLAAMQFCIGCCIVPIALWGIFQGAKH